MTLVALAIVAGAGGAFASKKMRAACEAEQQYRYSSAAGFQPVSDTYYCLQGGAGNNCTYYLSSVVPRIYTVCVFGVYTDPGLNSY